MTVTASVIIPSYRGEQRLPKLLDALSHQDLSVDNFEILVVIDGRIDNSADLVEAAAAQGLPARALVHEQNQGRVAALNTGFHAATGDVLIRCDDDLRPGPGFIRAHLARHSGATAPVGIIGLTRDVLTDSTYARVYGSHRGQSIMSAYYAGTLPAWRAWAANCSLTRNTWEQVGDYDTRYVAYGWEDVDYGYRLHEAGIHVILAPELETEHYGAADSTRMRAGRAYAAGAARHLFESLHPGALPKQIPGTSWWDRAVDATSRWLSTAERMDSSACITDRLIPFLPHPVATKIVALHVEAAARAGYVSSTTQERP